MKMIMAIIRPHRLDEVRAAIAAHDVNGLTVTEVKGYGRQRGHTEIYRGTEYEITYVPKLKLEIAVPAAKCAVIVDAIRESAAEGRIGDGKIFVYDLSQAIRVRTAEDGEAAL